MNLVDSSASRPIASDDGDDGHSSVRSAPRRAVLATTLDLSPARASRSFDDVIRQLRDSIYGGQLVVGDRLPPERTLALQFQVSRNMVREALRMLEITGIIQMRSGRYGGAFVCHGRAEIVTQSLSDMMKLAAFSLSDLTEARMWLSSAVVRAVNERATEADLVTLEENVDAAAARAKADDWDSVAQINMRFHDLLAEMTRNPVLVMMHASLMGVIRELSLSLGPIKTERTIRNRRRILAHLHARDGAAAGDEMANNLQWVHQYWLKQIGDQQIGAVTSPLHPSE